jgi:hypothetical protein
MFLFRAHAEVSSTFARKMWLEILWTGRAQELHTTNRWRRLPLEGDHSRQIWALSVLLCQLQREARPETSLSSTSRQDDKCPFPQQAYDFPSSPPYRGLIGLQGDLAAGRQQPAESYQARLTDNINRHFRPGLWASFFGL